MSINVLDGARKADMVRSARVIRRCEAVVRAGFQRVVAVAFAVLICVVHVSTASAESTDAPSFAVAPQYDTTHVYVKAADFDRFVASFVATFGGTITPKSVFTVTPTPSQTNSQVVFAPVGLASIFGFVTPIPYPFGLERTGYLVTDMDAAVASARAHGATVVVATFTDPIGRDTVIEWPGGVFMQLYWHNTPPHYAPLAAVPENRVYVSPDAADAFIADFAGFAHGTVTSDVRDAPGSEIGRPQTHYRRVHIHSGFGEMLVIVSDGILPFPYGREITGYSVADISATLAKATAAGATVLVAPFTSGTRRSAMVEFPGDYIAEIHSEP
jgi:predicted enzyme related to lactoylglutathione lyase